jgi:type VI secretion system protein ImpK
MTAIGDVATSKPRLTDSAPDAATRHTTSLKKTTHDPLLLTHKFIIHHPKSGLNPLVDVAAYLFSIIGKLKQLKSYRHLNKLHKELILEINTFQENAKNQGYSSEYILVSRYALCATLDDIISNTFWGGQGQWDSHSMVAVFNQDAANYERFFVILERIIKDPAQYIDVMELMYLCLTLGFKGNYRSTEFGIHQLEQIINTLYKRIRTYRGDINRVLAPFPIKATPPIKKSTLGITTGVILICTLAIILVIFMSLGYMLDTISNQAYQELMHIGNSLLYETV